jgi:hypothetical protein
MNPISHLSSSLKNILGMVLVMSVLLISSYALPHELSREDQNAGEKRESPIAAPDLSDIIPLASQLSGGLADCNSGISLLSPRFDKTGVRVILSRLKN